MANNWNIPAWLEEEVRERDKVCVYCGVPFTPHSVSKKSAASWEHIINDASIITRENIVLCCCGCNASKGQKQLSEWLQSKYCREHGINKDSQSPSISNIHHLPDSPTSSQDVDVYANVTDNLSGIKDVTCFYKVNESEYEELEMSIAEYGTLGGYQYTAQIPAQGPGSEVKYHIEAEDNAGQHFHTFTFQYTVQEENSQPQLNVYPTSHNFGTMNEGETDTWTFNIENTGEGELTWKINEDISWISVNRSSGTTTTEIGSITVTANTTGLTPGKHYGYIYVTSDGGKAQVYVEVTVYEEVSEEPPQIYVHPTSHNFGTMNEGETATWTFNIENTGGGELKWLMVNSLPWLTVTPLQGTTTTEIDSVTVTVNTTGLNCGTHYEGTMAIMTNGSGTPRLYIEVTIADCSNPQIYVNPTSHNFGTMNEGETATWTFYIENTGGGELTCLMVNSRPWLFAAPLLGTITTEKLRVATVYTTGLS